MQDKLQQENSPVQENFDLVNATNSRDHISSVAGLGSLTRADVQLANSTHTQMTMGAFPDIHIFSKDKDNQQTACVPEGLKSKDIPAPIPNPYSDAVVGRPAQADAAQKSPNSDLYSSDLAEKDLQKSKDSTKDLPEHEKEILDKLQHDICNGDLKGLKEHLSLCSPDKLEKLADELNKRLEENGSKLKISLTHNGNVTLRINDRPHALEINPSTGETIVRGVHSLKDGSVELSGEVMDKRAEDVFNRLSNVSVRQINTFHGRAEMNPPLVQPPKEEHRDIKPPEPIPEFTPRIIICNSGPESQDPKESSGTASRRGSSAPSAPRAVN